MLVNCASSMTEKPMLSLLFSQILSAAHHGLLFDHLLKHSILTSVVARWTNVSLTTTVTNSWSRLWWRSHKKGDLKFKPGEILLVFYTEYTALKEKQIHLNMNRTAQYSGKESWLFWEADLCLSTFSALWKCWCNILLKVIDGLPLCFQLMLLLCKTLRWYLCSTVHV